MKKFLFTIVQFVIVLFCYGQTVLNEIYTDPGAGKSEFIELYNSGISSQNVDCFTILTYWESGADKGWYVVDLPSTTVASKGWYVISSTSPFNVQAQTGVVANAVWNSLPASGYLKKYRVTGGTYTEDVAGTVTDLLVDVSPTGTSGHNYFTFLLQNGVVINGFWGGGGSGTLPSGITGLPPLTLTPAGACGGNFTVTFSTLGAVEQNGSSPGSDNGYARTSDGKCGAWNKTSSSSSHTPGSTNGSASGLAGSITSSQFIQCGTGPGVSQVTYNITGVSGDVTEATDFPIEIQLYYDNGTIPSQLDGGDTYQTSKFDALISDPAKSFTISQIQSVLLVYKTKRGCFDKLVYLGNGCISLPVSFTKFTAKRSSTLNVSLLWQTSFEINNTGFYVQRNINGNWENVFFVPSQAPDGNSNTLLNYAYTDLNNSKGISQYRLRQIDLDGKATFSEIRSVRSDAMADIKTIIYPNPSFDGRVSIAFDDKSGIRDIELMDMSGRMIRNWKGVNNNNLLLDNLNTGLYSLRITIRETGVQSVEKFVVNKR